MNHASISTLITHSGPFHADDVLSFLILDTLYPDATLTRTRDKEVISTAGPDTVVFDVGNEYDPDRNRFDHHQIDKPVREEGLPYSSFGLIWKHFGINFVGHILSRDKGETDPKVIAKVHRKMDVRMVRDIDAVDNGRPMPDQAGCTHPMTISSMLMDFRPDFDDCDDAAMDRAFQSAGRAALPFLIKKIHKIHASLRSDKLVAQAIMDRVDPTWIELPIGLPFDGPLFRSGKKEILYVVNPAKGEWQLNTVNVAPHSYTARRPLPHAWSGLRDADLADVTGVEDAVFCHTERFIAIARSREGIMKLLKLALSEPPSADT